MTDQFTAGFEAGLKAAKDYAPLVPSEICELVGVDLYDGPEDAWDEGFIDGVYEDWEAKLRAERGIS